MVQAQQVLDGIQHKVESEIRKGMDCLAQAKAELQVCTPCCVLYVFLMFVTHLACVDMGISTAVFVMYVNPLGLCYLYCLPLCIQAHVDKLSSYLCNWAESVPAWHQGKDHVMQHAVYTST